MSCQRCGADGLDVAARGPLIGLCAVCVMKDVVRSAGASEDEAQWFVRGFIAGAGAIDSDDAGNLLNNPQLCARIVRGYGYTK